MFVYCEWWFILRSSRIFISITWNFLSIAVLRNQIVVVQKIWSLSFFYVFAHHDLTCCIFVFPIFGGAPRWVSPKKTKFFSSFVFFKKDKCNGKMNSSLLFSTMYFCWKASSLCKIKFGNLNIQTAQLLSQFCEAYQEFSRH